MPHEQPHVEELLRLGERFMHDGCLWEVEQITANKTAGAHDRGIFAHTIAKAFANHSRWFSEAYVIGRVREYQKQLIEG